MNQAQIFSLTRSALKIAGTALAVHGATKAAGIVNSEDVVSLVALIAPMVWSHYCHRTISSSAPITLSVTNATPTTSVHPNPQASNE